MELGLPEGSEEIKDLSIALVPSLPRALCVSITFCLTSSVFLFFFASRIVSWFISSQSHIVTSSAIVSILKCPTAFSCLTLHSPFAPLSLTPAHTWLLLFSWPPVLIP